MLRALFILVNLLAALPVADAAAAEARTPTSPSVPQANPIDQRVFARLGELGIEPSATAPDTDFLRRLSLTTVGQLPSPEEIRSFVADLRPDKRARKIDELLKRDLHAAVWASRFSEWTGNSVETLAVDDEAKTELAQSWHQWLRDRFARNEPYDSLVRGIVTATSRNGKSIGQWVDERAALITVAREHRTTNALQRPTLDLFWMRTDVQDQYPVRELAERIASIFLGVRINCARCHDHPFAEWTQDDYQGFVRIFRQVRHDMSPELRREMAARLAERRERFAAGQQVGPPLPRITEVYLQPLSADDQLPAPRTLGGPALDADQPDLRVPLVDWMTSSDNTYFARNFVNRLWAHYFGRGLVEPLDGLTGSNEDVAYPELLEELAEHFAGSGYDIRRLESLILNSKTWQLSSVPSGNNRDDERYCSRAAVRLPPAETVVDMWHAATGIERDLGGESLRGLHAIEIGVDRLSSQRWDSFLSLFGQSKRSDTCDCGPKNRPALRQTLTLMSDPHLMADISRGRLDRLLDERLSDDSMIDELFLQTLSRWPTDDERAAARQLCAQSKNGADAWEDIFWSLLNSQEFITIH